MILIGIARKRYLSSVRCEGRHGQSNHFSIVISRSEFTMAFSIAFKLECIMIRPRESRHENSFPETVCPPSDIYLDFSNGLSKREFYCPSYAAFAAASASTALLCADALCRARRPEDFPVTDIVSFNHNIRLALGNVGYHGKVSITAYGKKKPKDEYKDAEITFVSRASKRARIHRMLLDIHFWALGNSTFAQTNVMVITKNIMLADDDEDTRFAHFLQALLSTSYNVLLAVPDDYQLERIPFTLNSVWRWSDLCGGGNPLDDSLIDGQPLEDIERVCRLCGK